MYHQKVILKVSFILVPTLLSLFYKKKYFQIKISKEKLALTNPIPCGRISHSALGVAERVLSPEEIRNWGRAVTVEVPAL